jgi:hypothetical protein
VNNNEDLQEDLNRSDPNDRASAIEELRRRAALQMRKPEGPAATGYCLNCDAHLSPKQRWCDADCRNDWQKTQRAAAQKGDGA